MIRMLVGRGRLVDGKGGSGGKGLLYAGEELEWSVPLAQGELYRGEGGQGLSPPALPYCNTQLIKRPGITHSFYGLLIQLVL
jgi:hypothetical protein